MEEIAIGKVERFFSKINVAAIRLTDGELKINDRIKIKGHTTDIEQIVESLQVEHQNVENAKAGDDVGIKTKERVREGDIVYLIKQ